MQGYRNPILPGLNPDPTVIRDGADYFLITSSFEYFRTRHVIPASV